MNYVNDTDDAIRLRLRNGDTIHLSPGSEFQYRDDAYAPVATEFPSEGWLDNKGIPCKAPENFTDTAEL